jgi:hypothetical protein
MTIPPLLALLVALTGTPVTHPSEKAVTSARLATARNAMRPLGREARLGPWRLLTDVAVGELTGLDATAHYLADAYTARYGLSTAPGLDEAVVIFASDTRFRAFARADGRSTFWTRGHAGAGLAAFALGRNALETRVFLVHELTHLLSRSALGAELPAWLDEGLAEDLAFCRVDADGRLEPDTLDVGEEKPRGAATTASEKSGPHVTVDVWLVRARSGRNPPLAAILAPHSRLFADPGSRRDATTTSAMLIRWCLAQPDRAANFRGFLRAVSRGGASDASALAAALGMTTLELQKNFFEWSKTF